MKLRLPLSLFLPLCSIALWVLLIALPATFGYIHLQHWANGAAAARIHAGQFEMTIRRENFLQWSFQLATFRKEHFLMGLNLPAGAVEALISRLMATWPMVWYPPAFTRQAWAAITWPFLCLPFWALAGAGIDAWTSRSVRTSWLVIGSIFCLLCGFLGTGLLISMTPDDRAEGLYAPVGFSFWFLIFLVAPAALIRKWKQRQFSE